MVRPNELSFARRGAIQKLAARHQGSRPGQLTAIFVGLDPDDDHRAVVSFSGNEISVLSGPHKLVPGALVAVEVDSANAPVRVLGPVTSRPEGLDEAVPAPEPVTPMPVLAPFSAEDQARLDNAVVELAAAQDAIADASARIGDVSARVGWSGRVDSIHHPGYGVEWVGLGGGQVRLTLSGPDGPVDENWLVYLPGGASLQASGPSIVVTATTTGFIEFETVAVISASGLVEVTEEMLEPGTPLTQAVAAAAQAAITASRIAARSLNDPTVEDGVDRPAGALWTKINASGEELAYWSWDGEQWVPQALSRAVIPLLDAAHISTGILDSDRVNVTELWAEIATLGKIITENLIAVGAVTAPALNVVHVDPTTGFGFRLDPQGLTILDKDGQPVIVLRSDMENYFNIVKDGVSVVSISPDGHIAATTMSVTGSFNYRGTELSDLTDRAQKGVIASSNLTGNTLADLGWAKIGHVTFRSLAPNRRIRATLDLNTNNGTTPRVQVACMRADGTLVTSNNSIQRLWEHGDGRVRGSGLYPHEFNAAGTGVQTVGFFIRARDSGEVYAMGSTAADGATTRVTVEDVGPSVTEESFAGVPSGGSQTGTTKTAHDDLFGLLANRSYRGNGSHYAWNEAFLYHGYNLAENGALRSLAVFSRSSVSALTSSADMESGYIELVNAHTWATSGMTVRVGYTDHTSVPSTWDGSGFNLIGTYTVERGAPLKIPLNATLLNAVKSGAFNAVALVPSSTSGTQYGYFRASSTELYLKVRK